MDFRYAESLWKRLIRGFLVNLQLEQGADLRIIIMSDSEPRFVKLYDFFSGELFPSETYNLVIPNYQRGYKWAVKDTNNAEAESSVEYLIKTIKESYNTKSELFLQGITVSDSKADDDVERDVVIIDGQQRLTTLYLLLWFLDKDSIKSTTLKYQARKDTDDCLRKLKSVDSNNWEKHDFGDTSKQDIYFIKQAISQIGDTLGEISPEEFIRYIKENIMVIYIPIARKEDAVSTFTMMNGSKAIMRAEELIKSELLRLVSKACQDFSFEATSVEEVLARLRDFTAMDWNTAEMRSRYAREWDKWLYWWNRAEVKTFYRTKTETRPLGLLLDFYYRNEDSNHSTYSSFKQFQSKHLQGNAIAHELFKRLRELQKKFEDAYNDYYTYNMLAMALSCGDRYEVISFFFNNLSNIKILKRYTEGRIIGLTDKEAASYATNGIDADSKFKKKKDEFVQTILDQYVYEVNKANAYRLLSYRNILVSIDLKERFNVGIFFARSLEHIHPKSKVYHIDEETGKVKDGNNVDIIPEGTDYPSPMPDGVIKRDDIQSLDGGIRLSEHSICNLVLLYGRDNTKFGNKDFDEKKRIFFDVTYQDENDQDENDQDVTDQDETDQKVNNQKKIIISRTLQHSLSKFANAQWGIAEMMAYYDETKQFLENDFLV